MKTSVTPTPATRLVEQPEPEPQEPRVGKETGAETLPHGRRERNPAGRFARQLGGLRQPLTLTCRPAAARLGIDPRSRGPRPHGNPCADVPGGPVTAKLGSSEDALRRVTGLTAPHLHEGPFSMRDRRGLMPERQGGTSRACHQLGETDGKSSVLGSNKTDLLEKANPWRQRTAERAAAGPGWEGEK